MDPDEWSDIFQYTGHVWRRKEFPTKLGGNRRFEAKRLIRVLDLMREERARLDARSTAAAVARNNECQEQRMPAAKFGTSAHVG